MSKIEKTDSTRPNSSFPSVSPWKQRGRLLANFPALSAQETAGGTRSFQYLLFAPIHYEPLYAYPLIIWLHSPGRDESQLFDVMPHLSLRNYVAAAPRGLTAAESGCEKSFVSQNKKRKICPTYDWPNTQTAIQEAEERVFETIARSRLDNNIAAKKIFLAGAGLGGTMALRLGTKYPDRFAGVLSFDGAFPKGDRPLRHWEQIRSLPIFMTVGTGNRTFSPAAASRQLRLFHTAGMSVSIRQYGALGELLQPMFQDANRWIMERVTAH